jgi:hypothetical protein
MIDHAMTFQDAAIGAVAVSLVAGIISVVRSVMAMTREVRTLGPSMQAVYRIQPLLIKAQRHQNAALRELGANGPTVLADDCLDEADKILDCRLAERSGGCA